MTAGLRLKSIHTQSQLRHTHTHTPFTGEIGKRHLPHRAVRPGPYLFEPCVFLRDFPHRAVDFFTAEICPSLHDEEEKAKLSEKSCTLLPPSPVCLSLVQKVKQNNAQVRVEVTHSTTDFRYRFSK